MTQKEKILEMCSRSGGTGIPNSNLLKYIRDMVVSFDELKRAGLSPAKTAYIEGCLNEDEDKLWQEATLIDSIESYNDYLHRSQLLRHAPEARDKLAGMDDTRWQDIQSALSEETLKAYLNIFPDGRHADECRDLLADLPWLAVKRRNTIDAYNNYMTEFPGRHDAEATAAINDIRDDIEWENARRTARPQAYRNYLSLFPAGRHAAEAMERIASGAVAEQYLDALREDPNAYPAVDPDPSNRDTIQATVGNGIVSWGDIEEIFGHEKTEMIKKVTAPKSLPDSTPPIELQSGSTEVYFWGTPGSGKTCALGTIISTANRNGSLEMLNCAGMHYMNLLSNIFIGNGSICTLPDSTSIGNIQEMILNLRDEKSRKHRLTLIDLAGELFRMVYKKRNNMFMTDDDKRVLARAMSYLRDNRNKKIHFFIVEYGAHDKMWEGLSMGNYLNQMMQYLKDENVFTRSTVGVYVLVTKCDRIKCDRADRPRLANEYVKRELASFWNTLEQTCDESGIADLRTLSFSVGDVFAQNLCVFDGEDTVKVTNKLLTKTPAIKKSWWDFLRK